MSDMGMAHIIDNHLLANTIDNFLNKNVSIVYTLLTFLVYNY